MFDAVLRQARVLEELVKARLEVDVVGLHAGMRARLEARLALQPIPVAADLADKQGPLGLGRVRTTAWEAPRFRKIVLSHIAMTPVIDGFALVALPLPRLDAPVFACDLMALPTRVSVNADVYGPKELTRDVLQPLGESFVRLGAGAGPAWATTIASGVGLHARVSPRSVDDAFGALTAALARYLDAVQPTVDGPLGAAAQRDFFQAFHEHGPRKGPLGRIFGEAWAERYSRLIFE
jgi:hypothetical protein